MIIELTTEEIRESVLALRQALDVNEALNVSLVYNVINKLEDALNDIEHNKKINDANN